MASRRSRLLVYGFCRGRPDQPTAAFGSLVTVLFEMSNQVSPSSLTSSGSRITSSSSTAQKAPSKGGIRCLVPSLALQRVVFLVAFHGASETGSSGELGKQASRRRPRTPCSSCPSSNPIR